MDTRVVLIGATMAAFAFGAFFLRDPSGAKISIPWRKIRADLVRVLSWKETLRVFAFPGGWCVLFYALVLHVRASLGRWPRFGESMDGWLLEVHLAAVWEFGGGLIASLYLAVPIGIVCLFLGRWRHVSLYSVLYAAAVGVAFAATYLAPGPFLNWFFD